MRTNSVLTQARCGTFLRCQYNSQFQAVKLTVSSRETHSFKPWNSQFQAVKLTVSSRETHSFIPWPIPWNNIRTKYQKVRRIFQDSQVVPLRHIGKHQVTCGTFLSAKTTWVVTRNGNYSGCHWKAMYRTLLATCGSENFRGLYSLKLRIFGSHFRGATRCKQRAVHCLSMKIHLSSYWKC